MIVAGSFSVLPYARIKLPNRREQDKTARSNSEKDEITRLRVGGYDLAANSLFKKKRGE